MNEIIGSFYFTRTRSGNLLGEYTNFRTNRIFSQAASSTNLLSTIIGDYICVWFENNISVTSQLTIQFAIDSNELKYQLTWIMENQQIFEGEAFFVDNTLVGHYRST